jgi:F-type H+-transporting ATPase subunit a
MTTWFVFAIIAIIAFAGNSNLKSIPEGLELNRVYNRIYSWFSKNSNWWRRIWNGYRFRTIFLFVFVSNGLSFIPWHLIEIPNGELAATNDINTTVALSLLTSIAYFYAGISKRIRLLQTLCVTSRFLLPINVLEDFTKPLSLSFRLFGNILADLLLLFLLL